MLNFLAANIYSTLLCSESQGMKLCVKVQCIFHSAGCDSAAFLHKSHGQCDFPWMQAFWRGNFPIVLSGNFCSIFAICNACHDPHHSVQCPPTLLALLPCVVFSCTLPPFSPSFLSCPLSLANSENPKTFFTCHYPMCV